MNERVVFVKLDVGMRQAIDAAAIASLDIQGGPYRGLQPSMILKGFVFYKIRIALRELTRNAVCRYCPFKGILAIRSGNLTGGDWIDGSSRLIKERSLNG
jgi:hypothetical protein